MEFSPEQTRTEIDTILESESYRNTFHPDHPATQEKIQALYSRLYPSEPEEAPTEPPSETASDQPTDQPSEPTAPTDPLDNPLTAEEEKGIASLKQEWAGQWEENVTAAQGVVESLSKDLGYDVADFLEDSRLGSSPIVLKAMWSWSRGEPGPDVSPAEAQAILDMARKSDLYQKGDSRARDTLLDVVQALYQVVHPEV